MVYKRKVDYMHILSKKCQIYGSIENLGNIICIFFICKETGETFECKWNISRKIINKYLNNWAGWLLIFIVLWYIAAGKRLADCSNLVFEGNDGTI